MLRGLTATRRQPRSLALAAVAASGLLCIALDARQAVPAGSIHGRFMAEGRRDVTEFATPSLQFRATDAPGVTADAECKVAGAEWTCTLPAGTFDAVLHVPGFAPRYFWGITASPAAPLDLGTAVLARGSTVRGEIVQRTGPAKGAIVELTPSAAPAGTNAARAAIRTRRAQTGADGSFSFADVGNGTYSIAARLEGYSPATVQTLRVEPPAEALVPRLTILPLVTLSVFVTPPVDYAGQPWHVALERLTSGGYRQLTRGGSTSESGSWSASLLEANSYHLKISTSAGAVVETREVELSADTEIAATISRIAIEGLVTLGDDPARASVTLISESGARFQFRSNAEGRFSGLIPSEQTWRAQVVTTAPRTELYVDEVELTADGEGRVRARIELPGGEVKGRVLDDEQRPVTAAVLALGDRGLQLSTESLPDGSFHLIGLPEGVHRIKATSVRGESEPAPIRVGRSESAPLTLIIRSQSSLEGTVADPSGNAVVGAAIRYRLNGGETLTRITGLDGEFSIPHAKGAASLSFAVLADGWPRTLVSVRPDTSRPARVVLDRRPARLGLRLRGAPPWPFITTDRTHFYMLPHLFLPRAGGPPREFSASDGRMWLDLAAGTYAVCPEATFTDRCAVRTLAAHTDTTVDLTDEGWR